MTQTVYNATDGADTSLAFGQSAKDIAVGRGAGDSATGVVSTGLAGPCLHLAAEPTLS